MSQSSQQEKQKQDQDGSKGQNIDLLAPTLSQSYPSPPTNKSDSENSSQQFEYTAESVQLYDCMKCSVCLPRCKVTEDEHCSNANTPPTIEQQTQGSTEGDQEKEVDKGNATPQQQNTTVSLYDLLDWRHLYPEDYFSTEHYFYSPEKRSSQ